MTSLFVMVPGFGGPHMPEKVRFLQQNLEIIRKNQWSRLRVRICVYDTNIMPFVPPELTTDPDIEWIFEEGIVGQFIHRHAPPPFVETFDHVLIILDDIELMDSVDFGKLLHIDSMFQLDVYSPCMTLDSKYQFKYMLHMPDHPCVLKITCALEAFCYFMPTKSYHRYWQHIDPVKNPWLWGLDMCLYKCLGIRAAVLNGMQMKHHYKNECYYLRTDTNPCDGYNSVMDKFKVTSEQLADQPAILYMVF